MVQAPEICSRGTAASIMTARWSKPELLSTQRMAAWSRTRGHSHPKTPSSFPSGPFCCCTLSAPASARCQHRA